MTTTHDYIVTFMVPLTMRVEKVDDLDMAEDMAKDELVNADLDQLLDATPFYVGTAPLEQLSSVPNEAHDLGDSEVALSVSIWRDDQ